MELSPQSSNEVQKLLNGESIRSAKTTVGPLDKVTKTVLSVLVEHGTSLQQIKGSVQAQEFRKLYKNRSALPINDSGIALTQVVSNTPRKWKLIALKCKSIRGIAPYGEEFEFRFDGESLLIFGPNGSGKSSLSAAIIWVFTGKAPTDSDKPAASAPLSRLSDNAKACDWDVVRTLPDSLTEVDSLSNDCYAQLELKDQNGGTLYLSRDMSSGLKCSLDLTTWKPCQILDEFGISSLDLQLSLTAPSTFGKKSIETAEDTRNLLSMMLGYDDLEALGELASAIAKNRTSLFNVETGAVNTQWENLRAGLSIQLQLLSEGSDSHQAFSTFSAKAIITTSDVTAIENTFTDLATKAEKALANVVGITNDSVPAKLADNLTILLNDLEAGIYRILPTLANADPKSLLQVADLDDARDKANLIKTSFGTTLSDITSKIAARYSWWIKETTPGSKASLLLKASHFYGKDVDLCPVCEKPITNDDLRAHLVQLSQEDESLGKELTGFFAELEIEIKNCFTDFAFAAGKYPLQETLTSEWTLLKNRLGGMSLTSVLESVEEPFQQMLASCCQIPVQKNISIIPQNASQKFIDASKSLQETISQALRCLSLIDWSLTSHQSTRANFESLLCGVAQTSLLGRLSAGKQAAADIKPLLTVKNSLKGLLTKVQNINAMATEVELLQEVKSSLDELKKLSKYAINEVTAVFESIQDKTIENWKLLYPEQPTGIAPQGLTMGKGKDKTVEAFLSGSDFKVPLHHFANAGWQRAAALSFFFALLERHPCGLGFFILDDPILSLDDEHRERWASELLKPILTFFQVILATHQRQFLLNCGHYFKPEYTIELNPRIRKRPISWHPGNILIRARAKIDEDWAYTANIMRQYREYLVLTVEAYSPTPFLAPMLRNSLDAYRKISRPNPLAPQNIKICNILDDPAVTNVLDPGSHALTQVNVTKPMVEICLKKLECCDKLLREELERLEELRAREMRRTVIPTRIIPFPNLTSQSTWEDGMSINILGNAAARSGHYVVDIAGDPSQITLNCTGAILVTSDVLDPVAKNGQWLLLGNDIGEGESGVLAAIATPQGNYLRRVWPDRERWILQAVNPIEPIPSLSVPKLSTSAKRIIGVLYEPETHINLSDGNEWCPHGRDISPTLTSVNAVQVQGHSLAPIAFPRQKVLVGQSYSDLRHIQNGALVVIETTDSQVGIVIKRFFSNQNKCVLLSPNPVDAIAPIIIAENQVARVWNLMGVLFEAHENSL